MIAKGGHFGREPIGASKREGEDNGRSMFKMRGEKGGWLGKRNMDVINLI
jgi:hypothetical protein